MLVLLLALSWRYVASSAVAGYEGQGLVAPSSLLQCPRTPFQQQCSRSEETLSKHHGIQNASTEKYDTLAERGPNWEVRSSPGKGLGVFATAPIPFGAVVMTEEALFAIDPPPLVPGHGYKLDAMTASVAAALALLAPDQRARFFAAHEHRFAGEAEAFPGEAHRAVRILRSNAYSLDDGTGRAAMFPAVARINHDCRPNAASVWSGGRRVVWAARDIAAGEEVLVTYVPLVVGAEERQARLAQYGFRCGCEACRAGEADDARRAHMGALLAELKAAARTALSKRQTRKMLAKAEELAALVEGESLVDYWPQVYRLAAGFAGQSGQKEAAVAWAGKEVRFHRFAGENSTSTKEALAILKRLEGKT
ncbi:hypothetical protein NKR23_g429 [Pleurostoma richardsiae]|uniref:SET domain-containing protein n=1 Tax=Pleurostoma richardsiae TaxID=41990 RepID=A0AA38VR28_9PEZI|nr:hypothetical protein NKR23_g429 [Pleurostoma richardsiae]